MKLIRRGKRDPQQAQTGWGGESSELDRIRSEINRIFEAPLDFLASSTSFFEGWEPTMDIYEDKDRITVKAELPGMRKEDIEVSLHGNTLVLSGERKHEEQSGKGETYRAERWFGRFQRSITLPQPADTNNIQASYRDGVLTITLPKSEESKPKQIQVKSE